MNYGPYGPRDGYGEHRFNRVYCVYCSFHFPSNNPTPYCPRCGFRDEASVRD